MASSTRRRSAPAWSRCQACGRCWRNSVRARTVAQQARKEPSSIENLELLLRQAVLQEDYKEAAKLRDQLREVDPEHKAKVERVSLQQQLQDAIAAERFQEAADLQKKIAELPPDLDAESDLPAHCSSTITRGIHVEAVSSYQPERSDPSKGQFFFVYRIRITNVGSEVMQLQDRTWHITDANGHKEQVRGPGVVGKKPILGPQAKFEYMSACPLKTSTGTMEGSYSCIFMGGQEEQAEVKIAPFQLTTEAAGRLDTDS